MSKITVKGNLINKGSNEPVYSDGILVKLYDKDLLQDDFLGQGKVNSNGEFEISFVEQDFKSTDSPFEKNPDLYIVVHKFGHPVYKSKAITYDLSNYEVTATGRNIDIGVFQIQL